MPVEVEKGTELVVHLILLISKTEICQVGCVYIINTHSAMSNSTTPYKACPLYYDQASVTYTNIHVHSSGAKKLRAHTTTATQTVRHNVASYNKSSKIRHNNTPQPPSGPCQRVYKATAQPSLSLATAVLNTTATGQLLVEHTLGHASAAQLSAASYTSCHHHCLLHSGRRSAH